MESSSQVKKIMVDTTVLILTYNRSCFIKEALLSVAHQTYRQFHIEISDCSIDLQEKNNIKNIVEDFQKEYPQISLNLNQRNERKKQGEHWRINWDEIKTEFLAILDDDDVWCNQHLERSLAWLKSDPTHGVTMSIGITINERSENLGHTNSIEAHYPDVNEPFKWLRWELSTFFGSSSSFVFRKHVLDNWKFLNRSVIDLHLITGVITADYLCKGFIEPSYYYRIHDNSNYKKGDQVVIDRHQWRVWLFCNYFIRIQKHCPAFIFLVIKSCIELLRYRITKKKGLT